MSALRKLTVVGRIALRALRGRSAPSAPVADLATLRSQLEPWITGLGRETVESHRYVEIDATEVPWHDTGLDLAAGDTVSWFASGRVYLSKLLDIYVEPPFQLWARVGDGPVFRGTRATHTFTTRHGGRLWLASYFPGQWTDPSGKLNAGPTDYARMSGGMSVALLHWNPAADAASVLRDAGQRSDVPDIVRAEAQRLAEAAPPPEPWDYLWYLGGSEIYRPGLLPDGRRTIACRTHRDVGILRREARLPLEPGTRLSWSWRVDALPSELAEDTLPSHDYLSIAVEFDDGQDITYYWSRALPEGTVYRCPLPTWTGRETHVVQRSGVTELGRWLDEERDLFEDYRRIIGGPARHVVGVWLIALSVFQRGSGRCEYAAIRLAGPTGTLDLL